MNEESRHAVVGRWLSERTGRRHAGQPAEAVHGGSINRCVRWPADGGDTFLKLADASNLPTYEAEAAGLAELRAARTLRVPAVLAFGVAGDHALLALEWLEFSALVADQAEVQRRLAEALAAQHRVLAPAFGWSRDNTIGATPQPNGQDADWVRFFRERRLGHMLELAAARGIHARILERGQRLLECCGEFFRGYQPQPSLLHGDLWGGNWSAIAATGEPVVFDPAVYYGDREADIAMTTLFGGYGPAFYEAYEQAWPLDAGAPTRRTLYNLYHMLNHSVLFGGSYTRQSFQMIEKLLAELG
ncbi:MAG: fructosamine kinase family protein [Steroidobacteraceae bacterium]